MVVNLDVRLRILRTVNTQDGKFGAATPGLVFFDTVWGRWRDVRTGRDETQREGLVIGRRQALVTIRYRGDIDASMAFQRGDRIATIVGGPAELGRKEYLEMLVEDYTTRGGA